MLRLDPLVDNTSDTLEEIYGKLVPECEEIRIATGYFYLSGFDLVKDDLENLRDPATTDTAPFRILMGRQTDRSTAEEVEAGQSLRDQFETEFRADIDDLNNAQVERLDRLREFIAAGLVDVRVRNPEQGYFHAKGAAFRQAVDDPAIREGETDERAGATVVGSSNFSQSGHQHNVELNLTSQDPTRVDRFEEWYDNQWANAEPFSEEIVRIIESSDRYQTWQERQESTDDSTTDDTELGTYLEPFEMYKLLAYDELRGNVGGRESPLYHFQKLGYESAREKLARYDGCLISDSVGLGKSFVGGELLHDYRQQGDRCLLIVPANLTEQWRDLLADATDDDGDPYFGLEVDGTHLDVVSISTFQNLRHEAVRELDEQFDVVLVDEAHRFRNEGKWRPNPDHDDDYTGTRRHANLRLLREQTMIMLTATPINNSATDLKNLLGLFTSAEELQNKASRDFGAFDEYIEKSARRKRIAAGDEDVTEAEREELTEQLRRLSAEISEILNEVMVLRTRSHVKETIQADEGFEMSFEPPTLQTEEYDLPAAYQPVYQMLPDVMDALHLPHITIKNPQAGQTLKALYKLNLLKRLESSTYAFVQSMQTLHESERALLGLLEDLPPEENIDVLHAVGDEHSSRSLSEFVEGADATEDLAETLEEFGFDAEVVRAEGATTDSRELADVTVGEVIRDIREDLTLLAYFLSRFVGRVAEDAGAVADAEVELERWLTEQGATGLPEIPEEEPNPRLYPHTELTDAEVATRGFYDAVFGLETFRDPKIDRLAELLAEYDQKVLVFTQYRGTADYVHRTLIADPETPVTTENSAVVKGGDENKQDVIKRFAPEASGYQQTLAESDETELQYVVATDTLSEGVNLQDISVVVNYDLPWNPMRIVQRVGRIDRIGSTEQKYVHNFYPDGDIEAAIKLLERLQAKIDDIALIVGKENNILDPEENAVLERAGVETEKTIGEVEVEEIENSLRKSRSVADYNELDDTSTNPLLRNAGSNEEAAYERFLLKQTLTDDFELDAVDFEFAESYFADPPEDRDRLYTNALDHDGGPRPGVFGLAHLWFEDDDGDPQEAPLGRVRRAFYYKPFGDDVAERPVRNLRLDPDVSGEPLGDDAETVLAAREAITDHLSERVTQIRDGQVGAAFEQGEKFSKEQETLLHFLTRYVQERHGDESAPVAEYDTIGDWATALHDELEAVTLANTDEDRVLRETFRDSAYESLPDWPVAEFLETLSEFLEANVESSPEFQETLVGESAVRARLLCWGVIGR